MKIKPFLLAIGLFLLAREAISQEANMKYIGIEGGIDFMSADLLFNENIRADVPSYFDMGQASQSLTTYCNTFYAGIKAEKFFFANQLGISGGLRYTQLHSSVDNSANFFYLLYQQNGLNTEYLRMAGISQESDYIGIPVDIRIFPFKANHSDYNIDLSMVYFKTGLVFNYRIHTSTSVSFYDNAMNQYKGDVAGMVGIPKAFSLGFNLTLGYQLAGENLPTINLEISLPTAFFIKETSGLVNPQVGSGLQFSIQMPFDKKTK